MADTRFVVQYPDQPELSWTLSQMTQSDTYFHALASFHGWLATITHQPDCTYNQFLLVYRALTNQGISLADAMYLKSHGIADYYLFYPFESVIDDTDSLPGSRRCIGYRLYLNTARHNYQLVRCRNRVRPTDLQVPLQEAKCADLTCYPAEIANIHLQQRQEQQLKYDSD
jgi:hypothetical protein